MIPQPLFYLLSLLEIDLFLFYISTVVQDEASF